MKRHPQGARRGYTGLRHLAQRAFRPEIQLLERRLTLTGNIAITNAFLVNAMDQPQSAVSAGEAVYIEAKFTTNGLPSDASYRVSAVNNGLTLYTSFVSDGAGESGTNSWYYYWRAFVASPGANQITVTVDPDQSVPETSYADNTMTFSFTAASPPVGPLSYTVSQIRAAYGVNSIPDFGTAAADGSGQTIAIVDAYNDPTILTDLDGFDEGMSLTATSSENLYQQYGAASSVLTVYNQTGTDITSELADSGVGAVPPVDTTGAWEREETMDVEWAHAMAPGAHIDLIESDDADDNFIGAATAADLPGVTIVSMSWIWNEKNWTSSGGSGELAYDSSTFVTPSGHPGVTFLASAGDAGTPGGYPSFSPNVVAVGATQLSLDGDSYGSETAWSFPTPRTLDNGSTSYSETGSWISQSGGSSGTYSTAAAGSNASATWTTSITSADQGWDDGTEVSATWVANADNATDATYQIYDGTAATGTLLGTVTVNQTKAPAGTSDGTTQFQELGDYDPTSGTLTVVLTAKSANGIVVADAVGIAPAWATGGGQSRYEPEPSYQLPFQSTGFRTTPDVMFDGSNQTGVYCYQDGVWGYDYSGTSLSSPCFAGLIAIANQGRLAAGGTVFNSPTDPTQTLQALYSLPTSDFHQVTSGYNGLFPTVGYNEVTGLGSPVANLLIPDLVSYDLPTQLKITDQPSMSIVAGKPFELIVAVEDRRGNVVTNDTGTVTIALDSNPDSATLYGTLTATVDDGVATFSGLTLDVAGTDDTFEFMSAGLSAAISNSVSVQPGAVKQLLVSIQPPPTATAGQAFGIQPVVDVEDQYGNLETNAVVTAKLDSGAGPLQGTTTATVTDGVATFSNLADDKAETITLIFSSGTMATTISGPIVVSPAAATQLVVDDPQPLTATAGQPFAIPPVIEEEDQYGNVETGDDDTAVDVALDGGSGPLQGTMSATVAAGVATFLNLADDKAETIGLQFTSGSLKAATAYPVVITSASAAELIVTEIPRSRVTAGAPFGFDVSAEDRFGNIVSSFNGSVAVALSSHPGGGILNGTVAVTAVAGVASFAGLMLDTAADGYTLQAAGAGLTVTLPSALNVTAAAATRLVVTSQPPAMVAPDGGFGLVVTAEDRFGNVVTSEAGNVAITVASGSGGALSSPSTAPLVDGIATVTGLTLNKAGSYTLGISGNGLIAAVSLSFTVTPPPTITSEQLLTTGKGKHKKTIGFALFFSDALDPTRAQNASNYIVTQTVKHGRKTTAKPVGLTAVYNSTAHSVSLILVGKPLFTLGGKIVVNASPLTGISDTSGTALDGDGEGIPGDDANLTVLSKDRAVVA